MRAKDSAVSASQASVLGLIFPGFKVAEISRLYRSVSMMSQQYFTVPHLIHADSAQTPSWPWIPSGVLVES